MSVASSKPTCGQSLHSSMHARKRAAVVCPPTIPSCKPQAASRTMDCIRLSPAQPRFAAHFLWKTFLPPTTLDTTTHSCHCQINIISLSTTRQWQYRASIQYLLICGTPSPASPQPPCVQWTVGYPLYESVKANLETNQGKRRTINIKVPWPNCSRSMQG